jgi:hypothetical protein
MEPNTKHEGHSSVSSLRYSNHKNPVDLSSHERKNRKTGLKEQSSHEECKGKPCRSKSYDHLGLGFHEEK